MADSGPRPPRAGATDENRVDTFVVVTGNGAGPFGRFIVRMGVHRQKARSFLHLSKVVEAPACPALARWALCSQKGSSHPEEADE